MKMNWDFCALVNARVIYGALIAQESHLRQGKDSLLAKAPGPFPGGAHLAHEKRLPLLFSG